MKSGRPFVLLAITRERHLRRGHPIPTDLIMGFNIVLVEPEIPTNTGNIGRLSLASGSTLHLVKPFGFEITDSRLKRAGLDYWQHLDVRTYESLEDFMSTHRGAHFAFLSSKGNQSYCDIDYRHDMFFVFGKESLGLPDHLTSQHANRLYKIPILSEHIRSLNLANAVSIIVYEGLRNLGLPSTPPAP